MLIRCPWCGERAHTEFFYGGDASLPRPATAESGATDDWTAFVYLRDNPRGPHRELWQHSHGCRQWFVVERDTSNHAVLSAHAPDGAHTGSAGG